MFKQKRREFIQSGSVMALGVLAGTAHVRENQEAKKAKQHPALLDAFMTRRSVRHYTGEPVPDEHIMKILDCARMAPTAGNQQPWKFIVTRDPQVISRLKETCISNSISGFKERGNPTEAQLKERTEKIGEYYEKCFSSPVYITVLTDKKSRYPTYNHWDGPLAAANLMIAARALGYGTVFYTDSVPDSVTKEVLNIPDRYERVCFTPVGIPVEWPETPEKKPYDSFIVENTF